MPTTKQTGGLIVLFLLAGRPYVLLLSYLYLLASYVLSLLNGPAKSTLDVGF